MAQQTQKCAHPACKCSVPEGAKFCSEYCAQPISEAMAGTQARCQCGHPECEKA